MLATGEHWVQSKQTVTIVWDCVHQSQGSIIFSSSRAGTESDHSWFLYERAVETTIQKLSKGILFNAACAPHGVCIPVGAALSIYMEITTMCKIMLFTTTTKACGLICKYQFCSFVLLRPIFPKLW